MEQQPGPVNWAPFNPAPFKGAVRLWAWEAFAAGAELVSYFRWRQPSFAQEQMHEALLLPNGELNEAYKVCAQVSKELASLDAATSFDPSEVALVFDYESQWAWEVQPQGADFSHLDLVLRYYRALRAFGISIDIVPPEEAAVENRKLVILPGLFSAKPSFVEALRNSGAVILAGPRTCSKNENFQIEEDLPPGALRDLINIKIVRVESRPPIAPVPLCDDLAFEGWREFVTPGAGVSPSLPCKDGHDAIFENERVIYLAGRPNAALAEMVVKGALGKAGFEVEKLHRDIRIRDNGDVRYIFNYGPESVDCASLIGGQSVLMGDEVIAPRDVTAVSRR